MAEFAMKRNESFQVARIPRQRVVCPLYFNRDDFIRCFNHRINFGAGSSPPSRKPVSAPHVETSVIKLNKDPLLENMAWVQLDQGVGQRKFSENMSYAKIEQEEARGVDYAFPASFKR